MQTFLPLPSFRESAACLDSKRLGKQRVECKQILLCLGISIGAHSPGKRTGWRNHPAVVMWRDFEAALLVYSIVMCREWKRRGYNDNLTPEFMDAYRRKRKTIHTNPYPDWVGREDFHASHRSNLLRKDEEFYRAFGWIESTDLPYVWPVRKEENSA